MRPTGNDAPVVIVLSNAVTPADIPGLCEGVRRALESDRRALVICDVGAITQPDAATVDAIARLQLTAKRMDRLLRLRDVCPRLQELIDLAGLSEVLPASPS